MPIVREGVKPSVIESPTAAIRGPADARLLKPSSHERQIAPHKAKCEPGREPDVDKSSDMGSDSKVLLVDRSSIQTPAILEFVMRLGV